MTSNNTGTAIVGGDWPHALPVTTYAEPKAKQTGLDWGKVCPPADETAPVVRKKPRCNVCGATLTDGKCARCVELEEARRDATFIQPKPEPEPLAAPIKVEATTPDVTDPAPGAIFELPTPTLQFEWAQLLADTADSDDRAIVSARFLALAALEHLRLTASTPARPAAPRVRHFSPVSADEAAEIARLYRAGHSIKEVASLTHRRKDRVSQILKEAGVEVLGRGGGHSVDLDDPDVVATARRLYLDEHLTIKAAADRMNMSPPTFAKLMRRHEIHVIRKGSSADRLVGYRDRLAAMGVTVRDVRAWWTASGHTPPLANGPAPTYALDAYEEAHR